MTQTNKKSKKRQYPPVYDKIVPIALVVIGLAIIILLVITVMAALGIFS